MGIRESSHISPISRSDRYSYRNQKNTSNPYSTRLLPNNYHIIGSDIHQLSQTMILLNNSFKLLIKMGRIKLGRVVTPTYKVSPDTIPKLQQTALLMGFRYGSGVAMGAFLDMLADIDPDLLIAAAVKTKILNQNNRTDVTIKAETLNTKP
jgi:hypothetical protein